MTHPQRASKHTRSQRGTNLRPLTAPTRKWIVLGCCTLLVLILGVWAWSVARHARAVRVGLQAFGGRLAANPPTVAEGLDDLQRHLRLLRRDLAVPLALAPHLGWLPRVGPTVQAAPPLMRAAESLLSSGQVLWQSVGEPLSAALREPTAASRGAVVLADSVRAHESALRPAVTEAQDALETIARVPTEGLLPSLSGPLAQAQRALPLARAGLDLLLLAPGRVGDAGPATYLLLAQNSDELRATGGFISSIGELLLNEGLPRLGAFTDSYSVENWDAPHPDPPEALRETMGIDLWTTRDGNWWPHFPASAQAVIDLYALNRGTEGAGVVALDTIAATRLVEALTPLTLEGGQVLRPGGVEAAYRAGWSLPAEALVAPPVVVTATREVASAELVVVLNNRRGTAWIDDVRVEWADAPGDNLLANGSFEGTPDSAVAWGEWRAQHLTAEDGPDVQRAVEGAQSLRLVGAQGVNKQVSQHLAIEGPAGSRLLLSAQVATEGVDANGGAFALQFVLHYADGTRERISANLPPFTHEWASAGTARAVAYWVAHRKDFIDQAWQAAQVKVVADAGAVRWMDLIGELSECLAERHIQLYAVDAELQALFERYGWAGALADVEHDYLLVVDSNVGYNKVSASMEQSMAYAVDLATGAATLTLRYHNTSSKAVPRCDRFSQFTPSYEAITQGCYWGYVRVYVPAGSQLLGADGADAAVQMLTEQGKAVLATQLLLAPGEERSLTLRYRLPERVWQSDTYRLLWQKQSGTRRLPVQVTLVGADSGSTSTMTGAWASEPASDGALLLRGTLVTDATIAVMGH